MEASKPHSELAREVLARSFSYTSADRVLAQAYLSLFEQYEGAARELRRWLAWSNDQYPDSSPGDVIAAELDGTITLDDGITTWNPLRATEFFDRRACELEEQLEAAREALERIEDYGRRREFNIYAGNMADMAAAALSNPASEPRDE